MQYFDEVIDLKHNCDECTLKDCFLSSGSQSMHDHSTSLSRNSHSPAMSDSGISVDAASNNSGSSASMMNVAALAKLQSGTMICVRF